MRGHYGALAMLVVAETKSKKEKRKLVWLGDLDSNQDCTVQSREFYR